MARSRFTTGTQYSGRRPYAACVLVEEALADEVALVVLVDAGPSDDRVPHDRVDPRVLERRAHEAGRVPVELLERRIDEHDAEAEPAVHERSHLRVVELAHGVADVLRGLRDRFFGDDADARRPGTRCGRL